MTSQNTQARRFASLSDALEAAYDHVIYLAGPDEAISILDNARDRNHALVLVTAPSASREETLWQADQIFSDKIDQPSLVVLANMADKPSMRMPFHLGRVTG